MTMQHMPVLLNEVMHYLRAEPGAMVCDCTLGLGGHAKAFAENVGPKGHLWCFEADERNLVHAKDRLAAYADRISYIHDNFRSIAAHGIPPCDVIFADLGLSSPHVDDPTRGFSFRFDAPLDLRFDASRGLTAAEIIEQHSEEELRTLLRDNGIPGAQGLAQELCRQLPQTTTALRTIVEQRYAWKAPSLLPQVFQALRILTNDEMSSLQALLSDAPAMLSEGGLLGIIAYHSMEDRMVKHAFRRYTTAQIDEETGHDSVPAPFELPHKKPIVPTGHEVERNPRARSAKLRILKKRHLSDLR